MQRRHLIALAAATALMMHAAAHAQGDRTIHVLVGFAPAGSIDTVARRLADKLKDDLKANSVGANKPDAD